MLGSFATTQFTEVSCFEVVHRKNRSIPEPTLDSPCTAITTSISGTFSTPWPTTPRTTLRGFRVSGSRWNMCLENINKSFCVVHIFCDAWPADVSVSSVLHLFPLMCNFDHDLRLPSLVVSLTVGCICFSGLTFWEST